MTAFYNEIEPYAAQWLENLIAAGWITPGKVNRLSIKDLYTTDLDDILRAHFFAGIAGWELALQLAGWPAGRRVWTGSCPCQPFSSASRGRGNGLQSEKHLWPTWRDLINECRPPTIFGEQVAHASEWMDAVGCDLEAMGYSIWAAILPAYSLEKNHDRPRIFFAAHSHGNSEPVLPFHAEMAWSKRDGYEPIKFQRPDGVSTRMGRLRAYGNAIVPQVAAEFIKSFMEAEKEMMFRPTGEPGTAEGIG